MSRFLIISFVVSLLTIGTSQDNTPLARVVTDARTGAIIVRSKSIPISGPKDRYHSLSFSIAYPHPHNAPTPPKTVKFALVSVVKARRLNTDLYVVFVVDGKEIHFSSNRSAIRKPVPGKPWIGERMVFLIPYEQFHKFTEAKTLSVKLGGVTFDFPDNARRIIGDMDRAMLSPTI